MRMSFVRCVLALSASLAIPAFAFAAQSTSSMNVSITVTAACTLAVTDINFGAVAAATLATAQTSTAVMGGLFTYTCASNNTPGLAANQGQNFAAGNRMKGALGSFLPYSLTVPTLPPYTGAQQTAQITATIPAQGTLPTVDTYTDQVVLTLTY
jgi:spore coat protein U-like protein